MKTRFMPVFCSFLAARSARLLNRFIFLLRVSRTRADPHVFVDRNLGQRESDSSGLENHNLSRNRQFHSAARPDLTLPELSSPLAELRYPRVADCSRNGSDLSGSATA